jgi:hypothetical protein
MLLDMFRTPLCPSSGAPTTAHAASGYRVVLCWLRPPALFCCYCCFRSGNNRTRLEETTETTPHGDQRLHVQQ